jgi:RNA:NAD 2'-phosphotransferase (TPT1/KptA family)
LDEFKELNESLVVMITKEDKKGRFELKKDDKNQL